MTNKRIVQSKSPCGRSSQKSSTSHSKSDKSTPKKTVPKKVVISKNLPTKKNGKSCSTGIISNTKNPIVKPKKTTKSEECVTRVAKRHIDCKRCGAGDAVAASDGKSSDEIQAVSQVSDVGTILDLGNTTPAKHSKSVDTVRSSNKLNSTKLNKSSEDLSKTKIGNRNSSEQVQVNIKYVAEQVVSKEIRHKIQPVKQYYKNENFKQVSDSSHEIEEVVRRVSLLDPIKELPEIKSLSAKSKDTIFKVYSDSDSESEKFDSDDFASLKRLREFRQNNYFECHSVKSRLNAKGSVTSLVDHKCTYRFYLNDRLFPIPLSTDHKQKIRCIECHLPLEFDKESKLERCKDGVNGTIHAKVKMGSGDNTQDMILMLPVKDSLIIPEKRKEKKVDPEVMYFGVIKMTAYGNSVMKTHLPNDSFALKYQKGYREFVEDEELKYEPGDKCDIIFV